MLVDKKISEFLTELKSDSPAPGGGSAAALAGAVGAALAIMVGNLTINNDKYISSHTEVNNLIGQLEIKLTDLEKYIDEDTKAFNQVMQAYKLPKNTDEEKNLRSQAIQQALQFASQLPLQVAKICLEILERSIQMLEIGNVNAASDAAVAGRMAHAAMWSALYNVKINLSAIKDQNFVVDMNKQVSGIVDYSEALFKNLVHKANEKI